MAHKNYSKISTDLRTSKDFVKPEIKEEPVVPVIEEAKEPEEPEKPKFKIGIVCNCERLNVREEPSIESGIVRVLDKEAEVKVDESKSTKDFYRVTAGDFNGYCMRKFIQIKD